MKYELFKKDSYSLIEQSSIPYMPCMAKHSKGKTLAVGIENDHSWETFAVAASFSNECLWL